ncbi:MAG: hypothetical protein EB015_05870 [Methylocystaceae bacterium]|nr:hypothetical protein [Methylocystaceae bacterium]
MADFWESVYKEIAKSASYIAKSAPVAAQVVAASSAPGVGTPQADPNAGANAQAAQQKAAQEAQDQLKAKTAANDMMVNDQLQKQASAASRGLAGNILSGGRGFRTAAQNVSSILLGQ